MITRQLGISIISFCCLLTFTTSASAECAWVLWGQETAFTERWWIPVGWPFHWTTTERTPTTRDEFRTLDECSTAVTRAFIRDFERSKELRTVPAPPGIRIVPSLWNYACVPFSQRPSVIEPGQVWR